MTISLNYPPADLNPVREVRNGQPVQWKQPSAAVQRINRSATHTSKEILGLCFNASDIPIAPVPSGTYETAFWHMHTSAHARRIVYHVLMVPAKTGVEPTVEASDPRLDLIVSRGDDDEVKTLRFGAIDPDTDDSPNTWHQATVAFDVDPDITYSGKVVVKGFARPFSILVYEEGNPAPYIRPDLFQSNAPILASQAQEVLRKATRMIQSSGAPLLKWSADSGADADAGGVAGTTFTNIIDGTTVPGADTAGWVVNRTQRHTRGRDVVPVRLAVLAQATEAGANNAVRMVRDVGGSPEVMLTVDEIGTSLDWYTVEGTIPAADGKIDVQARGHLATATIRVWAVSMYMLEPVDNTHSLSLVRASSQAASISDAAQTGLGGPFTEFTLGGWFRFDSAAATMTLVGKYRTFGTERSYQIEWSSNELRLYVSENGDDANRIEVALTPEIGRWYYIVGRFDAAGGASIEDQLTLFVDGAPQAVTGTLGDAVPSTHDSPTPFALGGNGATSTANNYDGNADEVVLWPTARTDAQIAADMHRVFTGSEGMAGLWRFENNFADSSPNGNDLTPVNGAGFSGNVPFARKGW